MFERYTERARRVIFFSRYEASQFGSSAIGAEHLLLGLLTEDGDLVRRFLSGSSVEAIDQDITNRMGARQKTSTSFGVPLTPQCKQILTSAAEEAEMLRHRWIGTEHLLLGMLRETGSVVQSVLQAHGFELERVREQMKSSTPVENLPIIRTTLHNLVDQLPEKALDSAKALLERLSHRKRRKL
jgi:ATP-dependent Clp protease ATP-binding subunit ClpC